MSGSASSLADFRSIKEPIQLDDEDHYSKREALQPLEVDETVMEIAEDEM